MMLKIIPIKSFRSIWFGAEKEHKWHPQKKGKAIGHVYFVPPNAGEQFYLRTLLTVVRGMPHSTVF
jgi:hypothetical protein